MRVVSSQWKLVKNVYFARFYGVPSIAHFTPYLADTGSDEQSSDSGNEASTTSNYSKRSNFGESQQLRSSDVVEMLRNLRNEPLSAFSFFNQLKVNGFRHDVQCYLAIIQILCQGNRGMKRELYSLFMDFLCLKDHDSCFEISELLEVMADEVRRGGSVTLILAFDILVRSLVSVGMFVEVINTLFDMKRLGVTPCLLSCNYLINRLTHQGKTDLAVAVYVNMKRLGVRPNAYTFAILVQAYSREGNFEKVWEIFLEMEKEGGQHIDAYGYNAVIKALARNNRMQQAEVVFLEMIKRGLKVNYVPLIQGYCESGDIVKALNACDEMENNGEKASCFILTSILHCMCMNGMHNEAIQLFSNFKAQRKVVDKAAYNVAIYALCKLGQLNEAVRLFEDMKSDNLIPDIVNYTTLIDGFCLYGRIVYAESLFWEMNLKGIEADAVAYDVLVGGFSRSGLLKKVISVLDEMKHQGLSPRSATHSKIIEGLCSSGGKVKEAEEYFRNVYPQSIETCASMINGYCESGNAAQGYALFCDLHNKGILVSKSAFKLLAGLCSEGEYCRAFELFKILLSSSNKTSKIMCGKLVHALCCAGEMKMAQWIFDQMVRRNFSPDATVYTMLMQGYFQTDCLQKSIDLFTQMTGNGVQPDTVAYTVLLDGLSKISSKMARHKDDVEKSRNLRREVSLLWSAMKEMNMKPDTILYTVLIDSSCKSGNIREAALLFDEMIERGLIPDTATYTALMSGYCRNGDMDMVYALLNEMQLQGIQPDKGTIATFYQGYKTAKKLSTMVR